MLSSLTDWLASHQQWLGIAIFLVSLTESLAVAGLVVPGVFLLFAISALAAGAGVSLTEAVIWAFAGAVLGAVVVLHGGLGPALLLAGGIVLGSTLVFARHPQMAELDRG